MPDSKRTFNLERTKDNFGYHAREIAHTFGDDELAALHQAVHNIEDSLKDFLPGSTKQTRALVASLVARTLAILSGTAVRDLSETLDHSIATYAFAAAHLIGSYELPTRKRPAPRQDRGTDGEPQAEPIDLRNTGLYL